MENDVNGNVSSSQDRSKSPSSAAASDIAATMEKAAIKPIATLIIAAEAKIRSLVADRNSWTKENEHLKAELDEAKRAAAKAANSNSQAKAPSTPSEDVTEIKMGLIVAEAKNRSLEAEVSSQARQIEALLADLAQAKNAELTKDTATVSSVTAPVQVKSSVPPSEDLMELKMGLIVAEARNRSLEVDVSNQAQQIETLQAELELARSESSSEGYQSGSEEKDATMSLIVAESKIRNQGLRIIEAENKIKSLEAQLAGSQFSGQSEDREVKMALIVSEAKVRSLEARLNDARAEIERLEAEVAVFVPQSSSDIDAHLAQGPSAFVPGWMDALLPSWFAKEVKSFQPQSNDKPPETRRLEALEKQVSSVLASVVEKNKRLEAILEISLD